MNRNDLAFELDEKQTIFNQLVEEVNHSYQDIEHINKAIVEKQKQIVLAKLRNANLRSRKPTTLKVNTDPAEGDYQINDEHRVILNNKLNELKPIYYEIDDHETIQRELLQSLENMTEDSKAENIKKVDLSIKEHEVLNEIDKQNNQINILKKKVTETELRIQSLQTLKQEGEAAYMKLKQREIEFENSLGGRIDCLKEIPNLQKQLYDLDTELNKTKARIQARNEEEKQRQENFDKSNLEHNKAINWQREREQLLQELKEIKDQIEAQEKGLQEEQKKSNSENARNKKYSQFVQKWKSSLNSIDEPEQTISQLWDEKEMLRAEIQSMKHEKEELIGELIAKNTKLNEEISRKRQKPEQLKIIFQTEQNNLKGSGNNGSSQASFKAQEEKLLKEIQEVRLKLAEKYYL